MPAPKPSPLPHDALLLAPMVAISHRAFRELILGFGGLALAYTEMASAAAAVSGSPYEEWFLDAGPVPERTVMQFYTTKPARLVEALGHVAGKGLFGADINFGCSAPNIRKAGGGVAWMRDPAGAAALVGLAREAWPAVLSAKLRLGETDDYALLRNFAAGLTGAGLDFLTLHPRLEDQKFRRQGRWDYVGRLQEDLSIPVVGNGDVTSHSTWARRRAETGCAGIMIGRAAVRRPWLFALIKGRQADPGFELEVDRESTALRFLDLVEARLPADFHLTRAQRFFFHYADNFSFAHHLKWQLENAPDLQTMRSILAAYFTEVPKDRIVVESD